MFTLIYGSDAGLLFPRADIASPSACCGVFDFPSVSPADFGADKTCPEPLPTDARHCKRQSKHSITQKAKKLYDIFQEFFSAITIWGRDRRERGQNAERRNPGNSNKRFSVLFLRRNYVYVKIAAYKQTRKEWWEENEIFRQSIYQSYCCHGACHY